LQAYNDITLNEAIVSSTISTLDLKAGRSIFLNADIDTSGGNGNIFLSANDVDAAAGLRQAGIGGIFAAPGTTLDAGSGTIALSVGNAGTVGNIELANVNTTGAFSIKTSGDILQPGADSLLSAGSIELVSTSGSVGTASAPLRVAANTLEASATEVFLDSPTQGITIGGVTGNIAGIETQPEGDVVLTALGDITISESIDTSNSDLFNILSSGNITLESTGGNIQTGTLNTFSFTGLGGNIQITAAGDISSTGNIRATSGGLNQEPGGDIIFNSGGTIDTTGSTLTSRSTSDAGGQIQLTAVGNIDTGNIDAYSNDSSTIDKGNIVLNSIGNINTRGGSLNANGDVGGGNISVTAAGNITTGNLSTASDNDGSGNISLNSNGTIDTTAGTLNTSSASGNAGDVSLNGTGNISTGDIDTTVEPIEDNDVIDGTLFPTVGRAGDIAITSTGGSIDTSNGNLNSFSDNGFAVGGSIQLNAAGNVATGTIRTEGTQEGGNIGLTSGGTLTTSDLTTISEAGTAGNVTFNASDNISTANILSNSNTGQGGSLSATSSSGSITTGNLDTFTDANGDGGDIALQSSTTSASSVTTGNIRTQSNGGAGGDIDVTAFNNITAGDIATYSSLDSGDISLTTISDGTIQTGNITTETTSGVSGIISIDGDDVHTGNLNSIGITGSGDITVDADGNLIAEDITSETETGDSGDIDVDAGDDANTGDITSETETGDSGDIDVDAGDDANTGDITSETETGDSGDIDVDAGGDANTGDITSETETGDSGDINVNAGDDVNTGDITTQTQTGDSGDIDVDAGGDINTETINSIAGRNSGDITLTSENGSITTGDIASLAQTGTSGDIGLDARGDINTGDITTQGALGSGDISLNSREGEINTGTLTTDGDILINGILNGENEANRNTIDPLTGTIESDESNGISPNFGDRPLGTIPVNPASVLDIAGNVASEESNTNNDGDASNLDRRNTSEIDFSIAYKMGGSIDTPTLANNLNILNNTSGTITTAELADLDRQRTDEYTDYLGKERDDESGGVENAKEALARIAAETGNQSAVVYISLLPEQIELVLFTPEGVPIRQVVPNVSKEEVLATARQLRRDITHPRYRNSDRYLESAQQLYQWLIAPLKDELTVAGTDTLLFSMDEGLRALPIAALHDGKQFLVEQYSFSMIPSLSLIDTRYRALQNTQALGMGASTFENLNPLPAVPVELSAITQQIWQGEAFIDENFTRANLVAQRQEFAYPIIHLATHGEFQAGDASNSYIQLWDEKLRLDELRLLGWNNPAVELLVLSACKTAVGDPQAELGFAGLAVAAGVKSAMASLWYVSDEGTLALMTEFYSYLNDTPIKAEALRQAQIDMIRGNVRVEGGELRGAGLGNGILLPPTLSHIENTNLSHPYYWSAFTTIGSPW
ncbi:CHAT domain-containing protein, partial [Oscillatoriales cyanobacterium LEGE 11467]